LHGRRLRRQNSEQRANGEVIFMEVALGVVIAVPGWMFDQVVCAGLGFGTDRTALSANGAGFSAKLRDGYRAGGSP